MTRIAHVLTLGLVLALAAPAGAQPQKMAAPGTDPDEPAIRQAALDYIQGWYEGNAERMTRAVHPELVKRIVMTRDGSTFLDQMGASRLIAGTRAGYGTKTPKDKVRTDVMVLDHVGNAATVKVIAGEWVDYLHIARLDGQWRIVNVLWEMTAAPPAAATTAPAPTGGTPSTATTPSKLPPPRPVPPPTIRGK